MGNKTGGNKFDLEINQLLDIHTYIYIYAYTWHWLKIDRDRQLGAKYRL